MYVCDAISIFDRMHLTFTFSLFTLQALAVTVTKTVTEPLELVSRGMSRFIRGALEDLPVHLQPPVFILAVIMLLLMVWLWFKHVLLISKQVKNLYKWTSIRW